MRRDIPKPAISSDFTIEDIRKIRDWNDECQQGMTLAERFADSACRGEEALVRLGLTETKYPVEA